MERPELIFRVFVSSTFSDLNAERNALQEHVFPRLRKLCQKHGARFQAIDLRWGVSEEASLDQQAMGICLQELKRCQKSTPRPNFILLLGDRYGWCPLPNSIPAHEYHEIEHRLSGTAESALLASWYRRDDNALYLLGDEIRQGVFALQPREGRFTEYDVWDREVQRPLHNAMERSAQGMALTPEDRLKYEASATHQEIFHGALQMSDTINHAFGFFRTIQGLPQDASARDFIDLDEHGRPDLDAWERLQSLKTELSKLLPFHEYQVKWHNGTVTTDHIGTLPTDLEACKPMLVDGYEPRNLCEAVWRRLGRVMLEEIQRRDLSDSVDQEAIAQRAFAEDRARHFIGREDTLRHIRDYVRADNRQPLVLYGVSGVGKSALMAKAVEQWQESETRGEKWEMVVRFIGATPASSDLRALLEGLCKEITVRCGGDAAGVPMELRQLEQDFPERLALATAQEPLVIFLDALDQLSPADGAHHLGWLPRELPPHARLVVSVLDEQRTETGSRKPEVVRAEDNSLTVLQQRLPAENLLRVEPLTADCAAQLLEAWLNEARRTLQPQQRKEMLTKFAVDGLPLYLKLAFEEARRWRSWETETSPSATLSPDIPGILHDLFARLEQPQHHGRMMVSRALGYLAASRHGLAEDELLDVLSADTDVMVDFIQHSPTERSKPKAKQLNTLPILVWSRLRSDLGHYLSARMAHGTIVFTFYHREVGKAARQIYLTDEQRPRAHQKLADYFVGCAKGGDTNHEWETDGIRGFAECVFHFIEAGQPDIGGALLSNFTFLINKMRVGLLEGVFEDYEILKNQGPAELVENLETWITFFKEKAHILRRGRKEWPTHKAYLQLAVEHGQDSPLTRSAEKWIQGGNCDWVWMYSVTKPGRVVSHSYLVTFEGHVGKINGALALPGGRLVSWGYWDKTLKVWDIGSGTCLATLDGHTESVQNVLLLRSERLLSGSNDGTLRLWDSRKGTCLAVLHGHVGVLRRAIELNDERLLSYLSDGTIYIWNSRSGERLGIARYDGLDHSRKLNLGDGTFVILDTNGKMLQLFDHQNDSCIKTYEWYDSRDSEDTDLHDGRIVLWNSNERVLRLCDRESGRCLLSFEGHTGDVSGAFLLSPNRLVSWSWLDTSLRIWNLKSGACIGVLETQEDTLEGALALEDGRVVYWTDDGILRLWDVDKYAPGVSNEHHSRRLYQLFVLEDEHVLSTSADDVLRLWDCRTGLCLARLDGAGVGQLNGAWKIDEDHLLTWNTWHFQLWNWRRGVLLQELWDDEAQEEWLDIRQSARWPGSTYRAFHVEQHDSINSRALLLYHRPSPMAIATWQADARPAVSCLTPDGTIVVGLHSGQIHFLKLYRGKHRVTLEELEKMVLKKQVIEFT